MKKFGTDGIRGKASELLNCEVAYRLGRALSEKGKTVAVAKDVRLSSPALERRLISGLLDGGAQPVLCGVLPTPALAYIADLRNADYAVMLTASHNPPEYNGLKVFRGGGKLTTEEEHALDVRLSESSIFPHVELLGNVKVYAGAEKTYKQHLYSIFPDFQGMRVKLDCAHGCMAELATSVFERLGCEVIAENDVRDGARVNVGCGATDLSQFVTTVRKDEIGFSFDGDGDRVISVVDGEIYDGDQALFAIAELYKKKGILKNNAVVGTVLTNGALEREFALRGITLHRADVGDKFVLETMRENDALLGGEESGHTILLDRATTGDGLLTALTLLEAKKELVNLPRFTPYPSFKINVPCENPQAEFASAEFSARVEQAKALIGRKGRLIIRPSGTEPAVRITVECENSILEYEKMLKKLFLFKNSQK